jgi:hypothetical protein
MSERLDEMIAQLASAPTDRPLGSLEVEVGRKIAIRRQEARLAVAMAPVRMASISIALALGVTAGGAVATNTMMAPKASGTFSVAANLAPSTLLEVGE